MVWAPVVKHKLDPAGFKDKIATEWFGGGDFDEPTRPDSQTPVWKGR